VFLTSEVPLYPTKAVLVECRSLSTWDFSFIRPLTHYRGKSLIRNLSHLETFSRNMPS
jgi:hypothetical protein